MKSPTSTISEISREISLREYLIDHYDNKNMKCEGLRLTLDANEGDIELINKIRILGETIKKDIKGGIKITNKQKLEKYTDSITLEEHKRLKTIFRRFSGVERILDVAPDFNSSYFFQSKSCKFSVNTTNLESSGLEEWKEYSFGVGIEKELKDFQESFYDKEKPFIGDKEAFFQRLMKYYSQTELLHKNREIIPQNTFIMLTNKQNKNKHLTSIPDQIEIESEDLGTKLPARESIIDAFATLCGESDYFKLSCHANDNDLPVLNRLLSVGKRIKQLENLDNLDNYGKKKLYVENFTKNEHERLKELFHGLLAIEKILSLKRKEGSTNGFLTGTQKFLKEEKNLLNNDFINYSFKVGIGADIKNFKSQYPNYKVVLFKIAGYDLLQKTRKYYIQNTIINHLFPMDYTTWTAGIKQSDKTAEIDLNPSLSKEQFRRERTKIFRIIKEDRKTYKGLNFFPRKEEIQTPSMEIPVTEYTENLKKYTQEVLKTCPKIIEDRWIDKSLFDPNEAIANLPEFDDGFGLDDETLKKALPSKKIKFEAINISKNNYKEDYLGLDEDNISAKDDQSNLALDLNNFACSMKESSEFNSEHNHEGFNNDLDDNFDNNYTPYKLI